MLLPILALIAGLILLVWSADQFVNGAAATARNFGMSPMLIGLTIVSFGTSAPEILVSVMAASTGAGSLAVGNALGSNIANIALVLGITALIAPLPMKSGVLRKEMPLLLGITLLAGLLLLNLSLTLLDSIVLLTALIVCLYLFGRFQRNAEPGDGIAEDDEEIPEMTTGKATFLLIMGLTVLAASSRMLVWGATEIALALGVSELIIGLTIVAIGTSLPELAASIASALKNQHDIAIGNVVGSNIFNLVAVMAVPGLFGTVEFDSIVVWRDYAAMLGLTVLLLLFGLWQKPPSVSRYEGGILAALYAGYLVQAIWCCYTIWPFNVCTRTLIQLTRIRMNKEIDYLKSGLRTIKLEAEAVQNLQEHLNGDFVRACELMHQCQGRIIVTGMGKSGHIGKKIAATLASTGTPAFFVHPGEASHGDLGMFTSNDVVVALSNSGETSEVVTILPLIKRMNAPLISITAREHSTLAQAADASLLIGVDKEACPLNLAPTSSTTAQLVLGDALAIALLEARGFGPEDFAFSHPGGSLGRRLLLKVEDIMHTGEEVPVVKEGTPLNEALLEVTNKRLGMTAVVDSNGAITGIFTDGDLRRALDHEVNLKQTAIEQVMTANCTTINDAGILAAECLQIMESHKINALLVLNDKRQPIGALNMHDLLKAGVI